VTSIILKIQHFPQSHQGSKSPSGIIIPTDRCLANNWEPRIARVPSRLSAQGRGGRILCCRMPAGRGLGKPLRICTSCGYVPEWLDISAWRVRKRPRPSTYFAGRTRLPSQEEKTRSVTVRHCAAMALCHAEAGAWCSTKKIQNFEENHKFTRQKVENVTNLF